MNCERRTANGELAFLLLALLFLAAGCAKVADPLPPLRPFPAVEDLTLRADPNRILLEFSLPTTEVSLVEVLTVCKAAAPQEADFQTMALVSKARLAPGASGGRHSFAAPLVQTPPPCYYVVRLINPSGEKSAFSNRVRIPPP